MRQSPSLFVHRAFVRPRARSSETLTALIRARIQTTFDGVIRDSGSKPFSSSLGTRAGLLALVGSIAAVSYTPSPPLTQKESSFSSLALLPILDTSHNGPTTGHGRQHVSSTWRLHTSAQRSQANPGRLRESRLHTAHSSHTSSRKVGFGSLAHPQPTYVGRLERLGLSFLRSSSSSDSQGQGRKERHQGTGRIHQLMRNPNLYQPVVAPRHPIILCHGLYGFDVRGPFLGLEIHYWANVLDILRKKVGAEVLIHGVPPTGSIQERAEALHRFLISEEAGVRGQKLNFIGHSMGGLDVRHLLANIKPKPEDYVPVSLTTVSTPHRGSPFMDWCNANIGIGNEYIEKALEEARANVFSAVKGASKTVRPPYSLKAPLFSRPKSPQKEQNSGSDRSASTNGASAPSSKAFSPEAASISAAASAARKRACVETLGLSSTDDKKDGALEKNVKDQVKETAGGKPSKSLPFGFSFIGVLTSLTGSFSAYMLSLLDTPAYAMLSTKYMAEVFNPQTPNVPRVKYYSVAARTPSLAIWHPLWLPQLILDAAAESRSVGGESDGSADALGGESQGNDGLVSVESAKWGEFLGIMEGCDHWDLRGGGAPRWKGKLNPATGKPWPAKIEARAKETAAEKKEADKEQGSSWIDINRLLFKRGGRKEQSAAETRPKQDVSKYTVAELSKTDGWSGVQVRDMDREEDMGESQDKDSVGSSFYPHDENLITDVAKWISERLPERDEARRAQAEERERLISETGLTLYSPEKAGLATSTIKDAMGATPSIFPQPSQAASFTTVASEEPNNKGTKKSNGESSDNLERFWIALCRNLHNEGY